LRPVRSGLWTEREQDGGAQPSQAGRISRRVERHLDRYVFFGQPVPRYGRSGPPDVLEAARRDAKHPGTALRAAREEGWILQPDDGYNLPAGPPIIRQR